MPESARGKRVDRFLSEQLPQSRATVQRWLKQRLILLDGQPVEPSYKLVPGGELLVRPGLPPPSRAEPDPTVVLDIVYEDQHLVVVNKPAGMVVHPGKGNWRGTLVNGLLARQGFARAPVDARDPEGSFRPGVVHRIDKDTSGLIVVAKDEPTREGLMQRFAARDVTRSYLALCVGVPEPGRIETLYGRHPRHRIRFSSKVATGKSAVTYVEVLETFAKSAALIRCRLETGRTHQIRVHLSEQRRAPLLADALYGFTPPSTLGNISKKLGRQALHARELGFVHPVTSEVLHFQTEPPEDFQKAHQRLRDMVLKLESG